MLRIVCSSWSPFTSGPRQRAGGTGIGQGLNGRRGQLDIELVIDLGSAALGPFWDHTLCAMLNDVRVHERHAPCTGREKRACTGEMRFRCLLGVKWSQVQILSARLKKVAFGLR